MRKKSKKTKKIDKSTIVNGLIERFNLYLELAEENPNYKIEWLGYADEVATRVANS